MIRTAFLSDSGAYKNKSRGTVVVNGLWIKRKRLHRTMVPQLSELTEYIDSFFQSFAHSWLTNG